MLLRKIFGPKRDEVRREDNIKMDLQDVGWRGMDWIDVAQERVKWRAPVKPVMSLQVS
jgi:hypothetical protein